MALREGRDHRPNGDTDSFPGTDVGNSPVPDIGTANPAEVDANGLEPGTYNWEVVRDP